MDIGSFGFLRVPSSAPIIEDQIAVLRLLGRLEYALTPQIRHLVYADTPERTMYRRLEELQKAGYIWRQAVNLAPKRRNRNTPPERIGEAERRALTPTKLPYVWGLTPEGKAYLEMSESEPLAKSLEGLKTRDRRSPNVPLATLAHDLQASWWCSSVIAESLRNPLVTDIFLQIEFVTAKSQRVDALLGLRMNLKGRHRDLPGIPWYDGYGDGPHDRWRWFALEIDRGTEPLAVLLQKAITYRDLTLTGVYDKLLSDPLLPVFIAPTSRRCTQIHREWRHAWPDGYGVIATPQLADDAEHGTLWGSYRHLITGEPFRLLPFTREQWQAAIQPAPTPTAPALPAPTPAAPGAPVAALQRPAAPPAATTQTALAPTPQRPTAPVSAGAGPAPTAPTTPQRPAAPPAATTQAALAPTPQRQPATPPAMPTPRAAVLPASAPQRTPGTSPAPVTPRIQATPAVAPQPGAPATTPAPAARPSSPAAPPTAAMPIPASRPSSPAAPPTAPAQPPRPGAPASPATTTPAAQPAGASLAPPTRSQPSVAMPRPAPPDEAPTGAQAGTQSGAPEAAAPAPGKAPVKRRVVGIAAPKRQGNTR